MKTILILSLFILSACTMSNEQKIDDLLKNYQGQVPGASLIIIKEGKILLKKGYGLANLEHKSPVESNSTFRLASVTKQFTAMCIMILEEQGKLSYDTKLTDIFPDFPEYGNQITIENILRHTSGLIDYESLLPDTMQGQVLDKDVLQLMKEQDSTYFEPGLKYQYSNTGYAVLAMIIEKLSGISFADFLKQNIFGPLAMDNSVAFVKGVSEVPHRSYGYAVSDSGFVFRDQSSTSAVLGDGGIYTNVEDMFKWDQALYTDKLVSFSSLERAWTPGNPPETPDNTYGYGWRIDTYKGHKRIHHNGSTCGFRNCIQRFPDDKLTLVLLTNRDEPDVFPIVESISDLFLEQK
ncbi:MAG: serine hydrolase [Calditrichaeota bacterium]|nr:serine hydrolase [Calditrichota bacterium]